MTTVPCYSVFAWRRGDETGRDDVTRAPIPEWNLTKALKWALERGCDSILIELTGSIDAQPNERHLCSDPGCPGGCK